MKKLTLAVILFLSIANISHAAPIDAGNGTVYDDEIDLVWYQDFDTTAGQTYYEIQTVDSDELIP